MGAFVMRSGALAEQQPEPSGATMRKGDALERSGSKGIARGFIAILAEPRSRVRHAPWAADR
jgi:hypothetical protein